MVVTALLGPALVHSLGLGTGVQDDDAPEAEFAGLPA